MEYIGKLDELPTVADALRLPYTQYKQHADEFLKFRDYCLSGFTESILKVHEWCLHLDCVTTGGSCTPSPPYSSPAAVQTSSSSSTITVTSTAVSPTNETGSIWNVIVSVGFNGSHCYDDYLCDHEGMSLTNHYVLGYGCFLLCLFGIISNMVLLPAYNMGLNRSGSTVYLSAMAVFDLIYLVLTLFIVVSRYAHKDFRDQVQSYAQFGAYLISIGSPVMHFCELLVVWIVVALLANRLLYMKLGFQSKILCSQLQSLKSVTALVVLGLAYCACKFLEYTHVEYNMGVVRVVRTPLGKNLMFQNLMYHWIKVPIQMFLPYLIVGALVCVVVRKMLEFHTSKWKAVASLCNDTACACVCRTGVCGTVCKESALEQPPGLRLPPNFESGDDVEQPTTCEPFLDDRQLSKPALKNGDPIEQELAYLFFQLPKVDETREHANVVTTVCIGLLLLILKVPKFILHVLSTENYITYDPVVFTMIEQFLDVVFAACKPLVCILVGAHFRQVLVIRPSCCASRTAGTVDQRTNIEIQLRNIRPV